MNIFSPLNQFEVNSLISLSVQLFDTYNLSITNFSLYAILVVVTLLGVHLLGNNEVKLVPSKWSIALEASYASFNSMVKEQIGSLNEVYLPLIYSLFFYVLIGNLISNVPYSFAVNASAVSTLGLSVTIFIGVTILSLSLNGISFFSFFIPSGTPLYLVRAPHEAFVFIKILSDFSCIFDPSKKDACCAQSRPTNLISSMGWIADLRVFLGRGLPHLELEPYRNSHVEVNKPVTYYRLQYKGSILSIILRYYFGYAENYGTRILGSQAPKRSFPTESSEKINKQATKTIWTLNVKQSQLRDSTASISSTLNVSRILRERSYHTSATLSTKGNSTSSLNVETIDINLKKPAIKVKPSKAAKKVGVSTIVRKHLNQNSNTNTKFYNLLQIIANPLFLEECYIEIKKKPGNMTKGVDNSTLDGINKQ